MVVKRESTENIHTGSDSDGLPVVGKLSGHKTSWTSNFLDLDDFTYLRTPKHMRPKPRGQQRPSRPSKRSPEIGNGLFFQSQTWNFKALASELHQLVRDPPIVDCNSVLGSLQTRNFEKTDA